MRYYNSKPCGKPIRTNQEWVAMLSGECGDEDQLQAHNELACYLFVVIGNQLNKRCTTIPRLVHLHSDEIDNLAQDFLQSFMLKMAHDNYAMLQKFNGTGRFLAWAAQIANNLVASEFRRVEWLNRGLSENGDHVDTRMVSPEDKLLQKDMSALIEQCLSHLPANYQQALRRCIMNGDCAKDVAAEMEITQNAVHILVYRAKKAMLKQLGKHGIGPESLTIFAW